MNGPKMPKGWDELTKEQDRAEWEKAKQDDKKRRDKITEYLKYFTGPNSPKAIYLMNYPAAELRGISSYYFKII